MIQNSIYKNLQAIMIKSFLKSTFSLLLFTTLLFACKTDHSQTVIGLWEIDFILNQNKKKINLPWQGIKFNKDGTFVSWNTRQHFAGTWELNLDTLKITGEQLSWMDSKWLVDIYTHPNHYRKIISGKLTNNPRVSVGFQLSKVHHLYRDEINASMISKPSADLMLLGKWSTKTNTTDTTPSWIQFNKNNTFLMGKNEEDYGNYGVWLLNEEEARIDLISFSTAYKDQTKTFLIKDDTLIIEDGKNKLILLKDVAEQNEM